MKHMKAKIIISFLLILTLLSISAVSASENSTVFEDVGGANNVLEVSDGSSNEVIKNDSYISVDSTRCFENASTRFTLTLTSQNQSLSNCSVKIDINGVNYSKRTNDDGQVFLTLALKKGTYDLSYSFKGNDNANPFNGTTKITSYAPVKTTLKQSDADISYRQGSKSAFIVRLQKANGASVKNETVTFKVNGKTFTSKTDSKGYAQIFLSLKKGTYTAEFSFKSNCPYLASSGSCKITVNPSITKGNGYWVRASGMKSVNFKTLKNKGTKQIFLHSEAISHFGKSTVQSWIAKANRYGIKVHIWMKVCYSNEKWILPVNEGGSIKYSYLNKKIAEAKKYAKIKGVAGVHFDHVRFAGTAYYYNTSCKAINYFVKKACAEVRKINSNCILSASVMPEPHAMEYYYGQDIPTMTKYLDAIVIMAYKGNYKKGTDWINDVTAAFVKQSNGAQVWTGLQAYQSDSNVVRLSHSELLKDAKAAMAGGAKGVVLFRIGITYLLDFNKV